MVPPLQGEFDFQGSSRGDGYRQWLAGRQVRAAELAPRIHLPLGHKVEVWLFGGIRLRGTLKLKEELLLIPEDSVRHLELSVDHVVFTVREMESCVRLD